MEVFSGFASTVLYFVISNKEIILVTLVFFIVAVSFLILVLNFGRAESPILGELGQSGDEFESTLRRVLSDTDLRPRVRTNNALEEYQLEQMSGRLEGLEAEVLEKDQTIADLNRRLTAAGSGTTVDGMVQADAEELREKIKDLEGRLREYEIIEDDIADLSKFKQQNDELKDEIEKLRAKLASISPQTPEKSELLITKAGKKKVDTGLPGDDDTPDFEEASGADLVAEFEKVVNNQDGGSGDEPQIDAAQSIDESDFTVAENVDYGEILMTKLQEMNIKPDSKEEAEVLINDLRSLKVSEADLSELEREVQATEKDGKDGDN